MTDDSAAEFTTPIGIFADDADRDAHGWSAALAPLGSISYLRDVRRHDQNVATAHGPSWAPLLPTDDIIGRFAELGSAMSEHAELGKGLADRADATEAAHKRADGRLKKVEKRASDAAAQAARAAAQVASLKDGLDGKADQRVVEELTSLKADQQAVAELKRAVDDKPTRETVQDLTARTAAVEAANEDLARRLNAVPADDGDNEVLSEAVLTVQLALIDVRDSLGALTVVVDGKADTGPVEQVETALRGKADRKQVAKITERLDGLQDFQGLLREVTEQLATKAAQNDLDRIGRDVRGKAAQADLDRVIDIASLSATQADVERIGDAVKAETERLGEAVAHKADSADVERLSEVVAAKADLADLDRFGDRIASLADQAAVTELRGELRKLADLTAAGGELALSGFQDQNDHLNGVIADATKALSRSIADVSKSLSRRIDGSATRAEVDKKADKSALTTLAVNAAKKSDLASLESQVGRLTEAVASKAPASIADEVAGKASQADLNVLASVVNNKPGPAVIERLSGRVSALEVATGELAGDTAALTSSVTDLDQRKADESDLVELSTLVGRITTQTNTNTTLINGKADTEAINTVRRDTTNLTDTLAARCDETIRAIARTRVDVAQLAALLANAPRARAETIFAEHLGKNQPDAGGWRTLDLTDAAAYDQFTPLFWFRVPNSEYDRTGTVSLTLRVGHTGAPVTTITVKVGAEQIRARREIFGDHQGNTTTNPIGTIHLTVPVFLPKGDGEAFPVSVRVLGAEPGIATYDLSHSEVFCQLTETTSPEPTYTAADLDDITDNRMSTAPWLV